LNTQLHISITQDICSSHIRALALNLNWQLRFIPRNKPPHRLTNEASEANKMSTDLQAGYNQNHSNQE